MKKIEMFKKMYTIEKDLEAAQETYSNCRATECLKFECYGARELLEAAGLWYEYFNYKTWIDEKEKTDD